MLYLDGFREKMAFFTGLRNSVPPLEAVEAAAVDVDDQDEEVDEEDEVGSQSSTLTKPLQSPLSEAKPAEDAADAPTGNGAAKDGSKEEEPSGSERFSYEIDPDIGVIV